MTKVKIDRIRIDGDTQPRVRINEELVAEYAEAMRAGAHFPPADVFHDGKDYWLADGFHRYHAARKAEIAALECVVHKGTQRDAILFSVSANASHGLRRTNEDKRAAVRTLLADEEWSQWSDREIARRCAVSHNLASTVRKEYEEDLEAHLSSDDRCAGPGATKNADSGTRRKFERGGRTHEMDTGNVGRKPFVPKSRQPAEPQPETTEDDVGQVIEDVELARLFDRRPRLLALATAIKSIRRDLKKFADDPLAAALSGQQALADLKNAERAIRAAVPYAVCVYCNGQGCKACHDRKWLTRLAYDASPPEMKPSQ